jgi:hypothetical protein
MHHIEEFMRQLERVADHAIVRHQKPLARAAFERMQLVAGGSLHGLHKARVRVVPE